MGNSFTYSKWLKCILHILTAVPSCWLCDEPTCSLVIDELALMCVCVAALSCVCVCIRACVILFMSEHKCIVTWTFWPGNKAELPRCGLVCGGGKHVKVLECFNRNSNHIKGTGVSRQSSFYLSVEPLQAAELNPGWHRLDETRLILEIQRGAVLC